MNLSVRFGIFKRYKKQNWASLRAIQKVKHIEITFAFLEKCTFFNSQIDFFFILTYYYLYALVLWRTFQSNSSHSVLINIKIKITVLFEFSFTIYYVDSQKFE